MNLLNLAFLNKHGLSHPPGRSALFLVIADPLLSQDVVSFQKLASDFIWAERAARIT